MKFVTLLSISSQLFPVCVSFVYLASLYTIVHLCKRMKIIFRCSNKSLFFVCSQNPYGYLERCCILWRNELLHWHFPVSLTSGLQLCYGRVVCRKSIFVSMAVSICVQYYDKFMLENVCVVNRYCKHEKKRKKERKQQKSDKKRPCKTCYKK